MSIRERIEDAVTLWDAGKVEGAWVMALIATAATSRLRYPKSAIKYDNEAFKKFIRDEAILIYSGSSHHTGVNGPLEILIGTAPNQVGLEDALYTHLRCYLLHEATMPEKIYLTKTEFRHGNAMNKTEIGDGKFGLPEMMVLHLIKTVMTAKENVTEFTDYSIEVSLVPGGGKKHVIK